jgi:hypothetical protein
MDGLNKRDKKKLKKDISKKNKKEKKEKKEKKVNHSDLLQEMLDKQLKSTPYNKKLSFGDLKRMVKYIDKSIFDKGKCCLWKGYVTNSNSNGKVQYINFYFKKRKTALHRILYGNFTENLGDDEYLKFTCRNRGKCCNLNHMQKFAYTTRDDNDKNKNNKEVEEPNNSHTDEKSNTGDDYYTISFN